MLKQKEKPIAIKLEELKPMQNQANAQHVEEIVMAKKFPATAPQVRVKQEGGFTAIELLFALGIIAIATVVIVRAMSSNSDKAHAQQMLADVTAIANNIKGAYSNTSDGYTGLTTADAVNEKTIPKDLRINGDKIANQFSGGAVEIKEASDSSFTIEYTGVPSAVCNLVTPQLATDPFLSIKVGGDGGGEIYSPEVQLNPGEVGKACSGEKTVVMDFVVG